MRVLIVSLFHPELVRGGSQRVALDLFEALQTRRAAAPGMEVHLLSSCTSGVMPALAHAGTAISGFDGRADQHLFFSDHFDPFWQKQGDPRALGDFARFLERLRPDVVHFQHFVGYGIEMLTLTRKVLPECRIVLTLHEFQAICAADGQMRRRTDGTSCHGESPARCHQCLPEHPPERFFLRKRWLLRHLAAVDAFTCPSRFMLERYIAWGLPAEKLYHVTNGQPDLAAGQGLPGPAAAARASHDRFGFFGQLHDSKGVLTLLEAAALLRAGGFTDFRVEINGDNLRFATQPVQDQFQAFLAEEAALPAQERCVQFNGAYDQPDLAERMARIDWCVVPSLWAEAFGLVISEAWMFGKPVIASAIGAMNERVRHDTDGLLFPPGHAPSLAEAMHRAATEEGLWQRLHAALPTPPGPEAMLAGFLPLYAPPPRLRAQAAAR